MAGKTFRGVGEDDDDRPRLIDEDDTQGLHSGPTVVDDQKVAEVLKKLRSLDARPGPLTGVTEVVDANSSEPTRTESGSIPIVDTGPAIQAGAAMEADTGPASLDDVMLPLKRATAIGRSLSTPADGQPVTVPADLARGTLFGHSIHLPDVNTPDEVGVEISSGGIHFLDGAPPTLQPFPLADKPVVVPPPTSAPIARFHLPFEADQHTQLMDPPRPKFKRVVAFIGGLSLAGLGVLAWSQYGHRLATGPVEAPAPQPPPPAVVPIAAPGNTPAPTPTAAPTPAAAAPAPEPAAAPAPSTPAAAPAPEPTAAAPAPTPAAAPVEGPRTAPAATRSRSHRSSASERRSAARAAPAADEDAPSKPSRSRKRPAVQDDPDATMAPSE